MSVNSNKYIFAFIFLQIDYKSFLSYSFLHIYWIMCMVCVLVLWRLYLAHRIINQGYFKAIYCILHSFFPVDLLLIKILFKIFWYFSCFILFQILYLYINHKNHFHSICFCLTFSSFLFTLFYITSYIIFQFHETFVKKIPLCSPENSFHDLSLVFSSGKDKVLTRSVWM